MLPITKLSINVPIFFFSFGGYVLVHSNPRKNKKEKNASFRECFRQQPHQGWLLHLAWISLAIICWTMLVASIFAHVGQGGSVAREVENSLLHIREYEHVKDEWQGNASPILVISVWAVSLRAFLALSVTFCFVYLSFTSSVELRSYDFCENFLFVYRIAT